MLPELAHLVRRPFSFLSVLRKSKERPAVRVPWCRPHLEPLEDRTLLSTLAALGGLLATEHLTGATIITHGFQRTGARGDGWLSFAQDIQTRIAAQTNAWLIDY